MAWIKLFLNFADINFVISFLDALRYKNNIVVSVPISPIALRRAKTRVLSVLSAVGLRRDNRDSLGMIFNIFHKNICCNQNFLTVTVLMRGHNLCFHLEIRNFISEISLLPFLIWSSVIVSMSYRYLYFILDLRHYCCLYLFFRP